MHAIAKQSPDVLKHHAVEALPLAFLAMHSSKQGFDLSSLMPIDHIKSSMFELVFHYHWVMLQMLETLRMIHPFGKKFGQI